MKYIKTLLKLKKQKELNYSDVPKSLLEELLKEGLVGVKQLSAKKKKVVATEYFYYKYKNLEQIANATNRSELTKVANSKAKKISPQDGFFIAGNCKVNSKDINISQNSAIFLKDFPAIDKEVLIVVVENFENLIYFKKQLYLFNAKKLLFIYRNKAMREFVKDISNKTLYFGDFDLAGIDIYLHQILPLNKNIELFIPNTIEQDLKEFGSKELFNKQLNRYKNLSSNIDKIKNLIELIKTNQKALEQEFYIKD